MGKGDVRRGEERREERMKRRVRDRNEGEERLKEEGGMMRK